MTNNITIYCPENGNISSDPSSIPQGSYGTKITMVTNSSQVLSSVVLNIVPPSRETISPTIMTPLFLTNDNCQMFSCTIPNEVLRYAGRASYSITFINTSGSRFITKTGSFQVTSSAAVDYTATTFDNKTLSELYQAFASVSSSLLATNTNIGSMTSIDSRYGEMSSLVSTINATLQKIQNVTGCSNNFEVASKFSDDIKFGTSVSNIVSYLVTIGNIIKALKTLISDSTDLDTTASTIIPAINELKDALDEVNETLTDEVLYIDETAGATSTGSINSRLTYWTNYFLSNCFSLQNSESLASKIYSITDVSLPAINTSLNSKATTAQLSSAVQTLNDRIGSLAFVGGFTVVDELPNGADADKTLIYLVRKREGTTTDGNNTFEEYIYIDNTQFTGWESLGHGDLDLSSYLTDDEAEEFLEACTNAKNDAVSAKNDAGTYALNSHQWEQKSEKWAIGTDSEDNSMEHTPSATNNSKYWAGQSQSYSEAANQTKGQVQGLKDDVVQLKTDVQTIKADAIRDVGALKTAAEEAKTAAEQAKYDLEHDSTLATHSTEIASLKSSKADKTTTSALDKRVSNLETITNIEDYVENEQNTGYQITVPANTAKYNVLNSVGANPQKIQKAVRGVVKGKTQKWNQLSSYQSVTINKTAWSQSSHQVIDNINTSNVYLINFNSNNNTTQNMFFPDSVGNTVLSNYDGAYVIRILNGNNTFLLKGVNYANKAYIMPNTTQENDIELTNFISINLTKIYGSGNEPTSTSDSRIQSLIAYAQAHPQYDEGSLSNAIVNSITLKSDDTNSQTISLSPSVNLNGLSSSQDELFSYIDGNQLVTKKIQRYGSVDLGVKNWFYNSSYGFYADVSDGVTSLTEKSGGKALCSKYSLNISDGFNDSGFANGQFIYGSNFISTTSSSIVIKDNNYTDVAIFKSAMNGVTLVYELATPTITEVSRVSIATGFSFEDIENVLVSNTNAGIADTTNSVTKGKAVATSLQSVEIVGQNLVSNYTSHTDREIYLSVLNATLHLKPNTVYTIGLVGTASNTLYTNEYYFEYVPFVCTGSFQTVTTRTKNTITEGDYLINILKNASHQSYNNDFKDVIIVEGSTINSYLPYYHATLHSDKIASIKSKVETAGKMFEGGTIDFVNKTFTPKYGKFDLGIVNWTYTSSSSTFYCHLNSKPATTNYYISTNKYTKDSASGDYCMWFGSDFNVKDKDYADASVFKSAMSGIDLIYELADSAKTPIDISDILDDDSCWLTTEAGGTVTFNNDRKLELNYDIDWLELGGA